MTRYTIPSVHQISGPFPSHPSFPSLISNPFAKRRSKAKRCVGFMSFVGAIGVCMQISTVHAPCTYLHACQCEVDKYSPVIGNPGNTHTHTHIVTVLVWPSSRPHFSPLFCSFGAFDDRNDTMPRHSFHRPTCRRAATISDQGLADHKSARRLCNDLSPT